MRATGTKTKGEEGHRRVRVAGGGEHKARAQCKGSKKGEKSAWENAALQEPADINVYCVMLPKWLHCKVMKYQKSCIGNKEEASSSLPTYPHALGDTLFFRVKP